MDRTKEIAEYLFANGVDKAIERFGLSYETITRYGRKYRERLRDGHKPKSRIVRRSGSNVLVIPDLHAPFIKEGALGFCKRIHSKYNCTSVIFIGDIIDNHYSSYHESDPDGHGAGEELSRAKKQISEWYEAFPSAKVCLGNHDILPNRKAFTGGLSASWIKGIDEVLETPNWEFAEEFHINGVLYTHGTGRKARMRCMQEFTSVVQGHYHSETSYETFVNEKELLFSMQLGCLVDRTSYAAAYGRHFKKPQLNCGVVMDNGRWGLIEHMIL